MPTWFEVVIVASIVALVVSLIVIYNQRDCITRLNNMYTSSDSSRRYLERLLICRSAEVAVSDELLAVYRALAKKLVSAHVTSTHIHLKVRSDYAQDGDLEKALGEITAVLRDSL